MEEALIESARQGDLDAFDKLVRLYERQVYNVALRFLGNPEDAFDVSQETFLRVFRTLSGFQGNASFSTWLFRVENNICIDYVRKESRRRRHEQSLVIDTEDGEAVLEVPDLRYSPESASERAALAEAVREGMKRLSPEHRQVLALREASGLSYAEIAQALDIEEGTVKSRIARARETLRLLLIKEGNFPQGGSSKKSKGR